MISSQDEDQSHVRRSEHDVCAGPECFDSRSSRSEISLGFSRSDSEILMSCVEYGDCPQPVIDIDESRALAR